MACSYGRVSLKADDDRTLFSESAGTCLLCCAALVKELDEGERSVMITERAHVLSHSGQGPRGHRGATTEFIDSISNLVLLCPTCHTTVDKAPEHYPADDLFARKRDRANAVALVGGSPVFSERADARMAVTRLLSENHAVFVAHGPNRHTGILPTDEAAARWSSLVLELIVPKNELIISIVRVNPRLATKADYAAAGLLEAHTVALRRKHEVDGPITGGTPEFPDEAESIFA